MINNNTKNQKIQEFKNIINDKMRDKKIKNIDYSNMVKDTDVRKNIRMSDNVLENINICGSYLQFLADKELEKFKLVKSNSCKNRFCPRCSWIKSKKEAIRLFAAVTYLNQIENKEFIFLTLTVPNVEADELDKTIKKLNNSYKLLFKRKEVKAINKGYFRKLEVTYNSKNNTYHPHIHALVAVNKTYFTNKTYLSQEKWLNLWKQSCKDNTISQLCVKKVDVEDERAILEMAKYSAKDSDYLENGTDVFITFYNALKGKRLFVSGGLIRTAIEKYEAGELDELLGAEEINYIYKIFANWAKTKYKIIDFYRFK